MAFLTSDNTPLPETSEAIYPSGSALFASGNAATSATIQLGSLAPTGSSNVFDAKSCVIAIANTGTSQTINAASLQFLDTVNTQNATLTYALSAVSIASGAVQLFEVALSNGVLKNVQVSVTYASAPTAGSVGVQAAFQSSGGALSSVNITQIAGAALALGQTTMSASVPVTIASNQSNVPENIAQVGGSSIALGQTTMSASLPVALASNQSNVPENLTQVGGSAITLGNAASSASVPVTLASTQTDQSGVVPKASVYVKTSTAGDTALAVGQATKANSLPVTLPSDTTSVAGADGLTATNVQEVQQGLYNGATVDQARSNQNITVFASGAQTATQTQADQSNINARGIIVTLDMTVVTASPSVTLEIDMKDPVSGKYISLLTGAAVTTVSTNVYTVYPGAPATANVSANSPLPRTWRVKITANNANSGTYSCGASLIV